MRPEVKGDIAKERLKSIEKLVAQKNKAFREHHKNQPLEVLVEECKGDTYIGYDQFFNKVLIQSKHDLLKEWVTLTEYDIHEEANHALF